MQSIKNWWERSYDRQGELISLHLFFWLVYLSFLGFTAYGHQNTASHFSLNIFFLIGLSLVYLVWVYYFFIYTAYTQFQKKHAGKALIGGIAALLIYINSDILCSYFLLVKLPADGISVKRTGFGDFASFYRMNLLKRSAIIHGLFGFVVYLVLPVSCKFFRDLQRSYRSFNELKERNLQLELNLIKSQVNPHFLLNTLNNIYGLTINGTRPQIGEMILNLSGFLKYSLYECNSEYVQLSKEIKLIQSYIVLEEIRSDFIETSFEVNTDRGDYSIPPFILFPLVENVFKHGTKNLTGPTQILMQLSVADNNLTFRVENDLQPGETANGGFGLTALGKKIEYYYPKNSVFSSRIEGKRYIAQLQITGLCQL